MPSPAAAREGLLEATSELAMGWGERASQRQVWGHRGQQVLRAEGAQSCECPRNRKKVYVTTRQTAAGEGLE